MGERYETVADHFRGHFTGDYDGSYGTNKSHAARRDFNQLMDLRLNWAQVHGDFKDVVKRAMFQPYPHWPELYQCCRDVIREHEKLETQYVGTETLARVMRDAMNLMRARHNLNAPRWWLPMMDALRGKNKNP